MRFFFFAAAVCLWTASAGLSAAQTASPPPSADSPPLPVRESNTSPDGSSLVLKRADGTLISVEDLIGADAIAEILQRSKEQSDIPLFDLSRLDAKVAVDGNLVTISAELTVTVRPDGEWVEVPIGFDEVHITGFEYSAPSSSAQAVPDVKDPMAKTWHLFGAGVHTIHLDLITMTRPTSSGGHLLGLELPTATQSRVDVEFQSAVELQTLSSESVSQQRRDDRGVVGLEIWGPENAFSLTWSEIVQSVAAQPALQVQNRMQLDLTTVPILLSGSQLIQVSAAPVDQLQVQMPRGFRLLELDVRSQAGVSILSDLQTEDTTDSQRLSVSLSAPTEGQLSLVWELELTAAGFPRDIQVTLPNVTGASVQNGDLDILIPPGLLVTQEEVLGAQRKRVAAETGGQIAATAFRLRSTDSRITLRVDEIDALYAVSPELILRPDGQNALMTVRFQLNVLRGSLLELDFQWPGFQDGVWQLLPRSARLSQGEIQSPLSLDALTEDPDRFSLQFPERQSGQFTVELQAFAPLERLQADNASLICPEVASDSTQPVVVTTIESDSFTLLPRNATTNQELNLLPNRATGSAAETQGRSSTSWLLDRPGEPIRFLVNSQAPSVTAEVEIELAASEYGIQVRENITYRIEHRDVAQLPLAIPEGTRAVVHLKGNVEPLRGVVEGSEIRTFRLPEPQRGDVDLVVTYLWPYPTTVDGQEPASISLPLVVPQQTDISAIEVGTANTGSLQIKGSESWTPVFSERFGTAWATAGSVPTIDLTWNRGVSLRPAEAPVAVLCRTVVVEQSLLSETLTLFEELPESFSFVLPGALALQDVIVNGQSIRKGLRAERLTNSTAVRWTVVPETSEESTTSEAGETASSVVITLKTRQLLPARASWMESTSLQRPQFGFESLNLPVIHWIESPDSLRLIPASDTFRQLSPAASLPWLPSRSPSEIQKIEALASSMRADLQTAILDYAEVVNEGNAIAFFADSDRKVLELFFFPSIPLLLISAVVCLGCFLLLMIAPGVRITLFLMVTGFGLFLAYAMFPAWTIVVAPYIVVGLLFGLVAVMFQRFTGDRQSRLLRAPQSRDLPTVFGITDWLRPASVTNDPPSASHESRDFTASAT